MKKSSLLRDGMVGLLQRQFPDIEVECCEGGSENSLREMESSVDLVLLDLDVSSDVKEWAELFQSMEKQVIVWVDQADREKLKPLFDLGLNGYFCSEMTERELAQAIEWILSGRKFIHPSLGQCLLELHIEMQSKESNPPGELLSNREWEVLELLVKGYSNFKIAEELFISDKTVKNYVSSILHKLAVPDRTNAVLTALKNKWLCL
ncbi:response regulator transcription factor [Pelagirhabdus alkalitolerans]|nr:response regulator transcription factor [Pelagirhabdus alkalitolerans]